jgi:chromosome segregation ATPase
MSDEELRDQINRIAMQIEKIEQTAKQKETYITTKLNNEVIPKLSELEGQLQHHRTILADVNQKLDELTSKKKELLTNISNLEKEYNTLKKEKEKTLHDNLKAIEREKKSKTRDINREIKKLEKELKALETK